MIEGIRTSGCEKRVYRHNDMEHLEELLSELEGLRDWVSRDVAWAAMQRVREARSLDAFISELQAEVSELGDEIGDEIAEVGGELDARATALAGEERGGACAICLGDLDDDAEAPLAAARVACGHAFHVDCLRPWLAHCAREKRALTCPTCRTPVCPVVAPDVEAGDVVPVNSGLE